MKWFIFSIAALLCWSFSDLFSKIGCADAKDKHSALKMVTAVGVVMGLHAAYTLIFTDVDFTFQTMLTYLPVSFLYISSMTIGYVGLRFIELSISSPICNSSGSLASIISIITGMAVLVKAQYIAIALVAIGIVGLSIVEMTEDDDLRAARQSKSNYKYTKSVLAILLPVIYCLLDALGSFADSLVLEKLDEDAANTSYELTLYSPLSMRVLISSTLSCLISGLFANMFLMVAKSFASEESSTSSLLPTLSILLDAATA